MTVTSGNILLLVDEKEKKSKIVELTDEGGDPSDRAEVIATGPDSVADVGDRVLYNTRAGRYVKLDDTEYVLVSETDIFIILNKKGK